MTSTLRKDKKKNKIFKKLRKNSKILQVKGNCYKDTTATAAVIATSVVLHS